MIRKSVRCATLLVVALSATATTVGAQNLVDRSRLDLRLAARLSSRTSTSRAGVVKTTDAGGILASVGLAHWHREGLALTATVTLHRAEVDESTTGGRSWQTDRAFSVPLLVGLRYFIPSPAETARWRPWASGEAGPIIGIEVTSAEEYYGGTSRSAIGLRFALAVRGGVGLDVRLSDLVTVSGSAGYLLVPGFLDQNGNQGNHEGLDMGITLGLSLK